MGHETNYDRQDKKYYTRKTVNDSEYQEQQADIATQEKPAGELGNAAAMAAQKRSAATPAPTPDPDEIPSAAKYTSPLALASAMAEYRRRHPKAPEPKFKPQGKE